MADPVSFACRDGKDHEQHDSSQVQSNLSGLKHALHGMSYQLKLGIVVCLANAKKAMDPANKFSFTVMAEDPTAGKFDDIVYAFKDGEKKGRLYIQAKHKLGSPAPTVAVKDLTTTSDTKNPFAILKYFTSFCDQQQSMTDVEGFIICTNADIDDKAGDMWKAVDWTMTDDSVKSLDFYVSELLDNCGGKCYKLDYVKLLTTYCSFYQLLRQCSRRTRLARLLVEVIKSNGQKQITHSNPLYRQYRQAILEVIDKSEPSTNGSYRFTNEFLTPSLPNSKQGYASFRKEFEDQYRQEFKIEGCVWDDLKEQWVYLSNDFLLDAKNEYSSSDSFPDDNVDDSFKSFCVRFRLVCGTNNEHELDEAITKIWRNLHYVDNRLTADRRKGYVEENLATKRLFKTNFDWLMDPFAKPLHSEVVIKDLENIENSLTLMKMKGTSDKLRMKVLGSPFRISADSLKASDLYERMDYDNYLDIETYDIKFCATLVSDILTLQAKDNVCTLFLDDTDIVNDSDALEAVLRCYEPSICLIIICNEAIEAAQNILRTWKEGIPKFNEKQLLVIRKSNDIPTNLSRFCICDLNKESWKHLLEDDIALCTTTISPAKVFQNRFLELSIEEVIRLLDDGKQMEEHNEISRKYREIEANYAHRYWVPQKKKQKIENLKRHSLTKISYRLKNPHLLEWNETTWKKKTDHMKKERHFIQIFTGGIDSEIVHEPIVCEDAKKVLILLAEAGSGKSTNLTCLAWYLRKQNPSSLVVRCNLSEHCIDFQEFMPDQRKRKPVKIIDEMEGLKMLFRLVHSSIQIERSGVQACLECLDFSNGLVMLNGKRMKQDDISLSNLIHLLVFAEKFNAGELLLLLDAFDEIAPHYKEVVLKILCWFTQFKGVRKLYITSRPYSFSEQFEKTFKDSSFFQLSPLSLRDKGSILYKTIKKKWHNGSIDDEELSVFYKWLCTKLLSSLGDMSNVPLNLMMAVDILGEPFYQNQHINKCFFSKTILVHLFETIINISNASFSVEEFVKIKIRHLIYDKNGANKNVALKPSEIDKFEKAIDEIKLQHGLVALWIFYDKSERDLILTVNEKREADDYMNAISEGKEKTGIIYGIQDGIPMFMHRTFAEYLAAWWIVNRHTEGPIRQSYLKPSENQYELRKYIDTILAKQCPLHLAIVEREWGTVESLLSTNSKALYEKDEGNRTPFHLLAYYYDFTKSWPDFLPESIENDVINCKEKLLGWTALDYAFHPTKVPQEKNDVQKHCSQFINYLLYHGAAINVDVLYDQVVTPGQVKVRQAARYAKFVMKYLSRQAIVYETHDTCKMMKQFCDKVMRYLIDFDHNYKKDNDAQPNVEPIIEHIIREDSMWMLESVIQKADEDHFVQMTRNSFFKLALTSKSMFVLRYFTANDSSMLNEKILRESIVYTVLYDYKIEFKHFFDIYCSQLEIKDFQVNLIQTDDAGYIIDVLRYNVMNKVFSLIENVCWTKLGIPTEIMIDENILSLLVICVVTVRPSMLRYLKESCKLNLGAGLVYCLAMVTKRWFRQIHRRVATKPSEAYECLLNLASNISDVEATKMCHLAITSELFVFLKCLINRYNIDYQAVDETNGWNAFHLCVSRHKPSASAMESILEVFRCMSNKIEMDFFGNFDQNGRSIFQLAFENNQSTIARYIVARKLGLDDFEKISTLGVDAIPNLTYCYRTIHEISKSCREEGDHCKLLIPLVKQIADMSLTMDEKSQEPNSARLLLQAEAKELCHSAMKCGSLFLVYYLHREFQIAPPIHDADWLKCTAKSLKSPYFFEVTKWLMNAHGVDEHDISYSVLKTYDAKTDHLPLVSFKKIVEKVDKKLSINRSVEDMFKMKLLILAVCLDHESATRYLCETLNVKIDQKALFDIMDIAHLCTKGCRSGGPNFALTYKYLLEQTSDLYEIDAEGKNLLHLAIESGFVCMAKYLIRHNVFNLMTSIMRDGWNVLHYCASRKRRWYCGSINELFYFILRRVLDITSYKFTVEDMTDSRKSKVKELCFNINGGKESVLHVAVEAGNIRFVAHIIKLSLGIDNINEHEIVNSDECSCFRECYDVLHQIAAKLPLRPKTEMLLHKLATPIDRFSCENNKHVTDQTNDVDHVSANACRTAIKYRSISTLERLIVHCRHQVNQSLSRSTSRQLVACMIECIIRNRTSMFKVLVGHYRTVQGIRPSIEVEYEEQENDDHKNTIDENDRLWSAMDRLARDETMNVEHLFLLSLLVAQGSLAMIKYLYEMLQLAVNEPLILFIMKVLRGLTFRDCKTTEPVYEYLNSRTDGKLNFLKLSIQARDTKMVQYLTIIKKLDVNEIDSETGWNAGHYCVSEPKTSTNNTFKVFKHLMKTMKLNCFDVYDKNGRSVLYLALKNGHTKIANYIIKTILAIQSWYEWDLEKLDVYINELQKIMEILPLKWQDRVQKNLKKATERKTVFIMYRELYRK